MSWPIKTDRVWHFNYSDNPFPTATDVQMKTVGDQVKIELPWMTIELTTYDSNAKTLKGRYHLHETDSWDDITFVVKNKGKQLLGTPEGFHGKKTWTLDR